MFDRWKKNRSDDEAVVLMYSSPWCGYCAAAKSLLRDKNVAFNDIDVGTDAALREEMMKRTGRTSVPQIFIGGQHIGGFDELSALDREGELDRLVDAARNKDKGGDN